MNARQFRQVVALAEAGSFRRAAVALKISQPTLSKSVSALEKTLRVPPVRPPAEGRRAHRIRPARRRVRPGAHRP